MQPWRLLPTLLNAGDLVLGPPGRPYAVNISDRNVAVLIDFPSEFLGDSLPAEGKLIKKSKSVARLLDFALSLLNEDGEKLHDDADSEKCIEDVFLTLLSTCNEAAHPEEEEEQKEARYKHLAIQALSGTST